MSLGGKFKGSQFFCLNRAMYHLGARTCEAAQLRVQDIGTDKITKDNDTHHYLQMDLSRNKTKHRNHPSFSRILIAFYWIFTMDLL